MPDGVAPGFTPAGTRKAGRVLIARYRAATPQPVRPQDVNAWALAHLDPARRETGAALLAPGG